MRLRDLVYLKKSDRQVLLTLLLLAVVVLCVIHLTGGGNAVGVGEEAPSDSIFSDTLTAARPSPGKTHTTYAQPEKRAERFPFDPNTADSTALLRLGLRPWQVRNIYKYRAAGGIYRSKKDFARLYGLTVKEYRELEPYIRISRDYQPASTLFGPGDSSSMEAEETESRRYPVKMREGETVDLNIADTSALKTIPGIGSYYARRIVEYGQRLGGYVSVEQLSEVEGVPPEAKAFVVVSQPHPRQMAINRLTLNELKRHPYINFYQARAITDYRRLHGPIGSLGDLRLLPEFPPEAIARLDPYVSFE